MEMCPFKLTYIVLIDCDHYWDLNTGEVRRGRTGTVVISTRLEWALSGPVMPYDQQASHMTSLVTHTLQVDASPDDAQTLDDCLKSFWSLESFGIETAEDPVLEDFQANVAFIDGLSGVVALEGSLSVSARQPSTLSSPFEGTAEAAPPRERYYGEVPLHH